MKNILVLLLFLASITGLQSQVKMQSTIKHGATPMTVDIYVKPSASFSQKDEAMLFALAIPATMLPAPSLGSAGVTPNSPGTVNGIIGIQPNFLINNLGATQREVLTTMESINGIEHFIYIFIFAGTSTSNHDWVADKEQLLFSIQFNGCTSNCMSSVKLVSLPNGGTSKQAYLYFQSNTLGDITNYPQPFYSNPDALPPINGGSLTGATLSQIEMTDVVLPVKLISFDAAERNCVVNLTWQVTAETDFDSYIVERSNDANRFYEVGRLSKSPENAATKTYRFADDRADKGLQYYRLRLTDLDGKVSFTAVKPINVSCVAKHPVQVYPTLSNGIINVKLPAGFENASIKIINSSGVVVANNNSKGFYRLLNLKNLASGGYLLQIVNNRNVTDNVKIILQK